MIKSMLRSPSLNVRLIMIMLFLSLFLITVLLFLYGEAEKKVLKDIELQTADLTKAIQIGVEEVTGKGSTDEARLSHYLQKLNTGGVKEISIISNADEVVASTDPKRIGEAISHRKKELIIKAELGEPVSSEAGAFNVIVPVVAGGTQYGYVHLKINRDDFRQVMRANATNRILATIVVFGFGILFTLILSRQYTRPIEKVVDAAMRVAAGDLNQQVKVQSKDEIGKLSESFNFMVTKLRETRSLEERLREAEHLSGLGQLSRHMAHEIRNPLNFISLSIDHIGEKYRPGDAARDEKFLSLISGIKQEIRRLDTLVNEFLDYSKPLKLNRKIVSVDKLLDETIDLVWAKAEVEGITIAKEYHDRVELSLDPDLFKTCLLNVVANAFQAMASQPGEKRLTISTSLSEKGFTVAVRDKGEGVPPEHLEKIFEPFYSTKQNGLGLGLPLTKRVMEEHGGCVEFLSEPGKGSEVRLILPVRERESRPSASDGPDEKGTDPCPS